MARERERERLPFLRLATVVVVVATTTTTMRRSSSSPSMSLCWANDDGNEERDDQEEDEEVSRTSSSAAGGSDEASPSSSSSSRSTRTMCCTKRWAPENAHVALRLLLDARWAREVLGEEETEKRQEKKSDDDDATTRKQLESKYRGIRIDVLKAPRECAVRTCLVHCGAREVTLDDGAEEEEEEEEETTTTTTNIGRSTLKSENEVIDDGFKIRSKTAKVGLEIVKKCLDLDEESRAQQQQANGQPRQQRHFVVRMLLPTGQCGQCIGKGGANIKRLRKKAPMCEVKIHDVGQIPPCATEEDRVLEMIGEREDIEVVAAELFETLSYFHMDESVLPYFESLAVCNRSKQKKHAVVDQYGRSVGDGNRVHMHMPPSRLAANLGPTHHQFPGQPQPIPMIVPNHMIAPATIVSPPYNPMMAAAAVGGNAFQDPIATSAQAQQVAAVQIMQHQQTQQAHRMDALKFAPDFLGGLEPPASSNGEMGGSGALGGAFVTPAHGMATNSNAPVADFGQADALKYNPMPIGPANVPVVPVAAATVTGEIPVAFVPVASAAPVAVNPAMSSMFSGGGFGGLDIPDIVQTTTPAGATMPVIPTQMLEHSKEDKEDTVNESPQISTSTNTKLNVWSDSGNVATPNPDPLNVIDFLPGEDLYAFDEDSHGNVNYTQPVPVVNDEQDDFTEMAKISIPKKSLGIVLGEGSANTSVVARMSDCYISVAVDPNPNAEEATICMLGKTEDAVGNAKDAFEALALGAESHPG